MFDDAYKLALPPEIKVHPVFHVLLLKEYFEDSVRPEREQVLRHVSELVENREEYEVETILNKYKLRFRDKEYLVKRRGYDVNETTWIPSLHFRNGKRAVKDFKGWAKSEKWQKGMLMRASTPLGGGGSREQNVAKLGSLDACQNIVLRNSGNKAYHFFV